VVSVGEKWSIGWLAGEKNLCLADKLSQHLLTLVDLHSYCCLDSQINISLFEEHKLQCIRSTFEYAPHLLLKSFQMFCQTLQFHIQGECPFNKTEFIICK
jgi:hypothetical protein